MPAIGVLPPVSDVGRRAGDGAGGRKAAEQRAARLDSPCAISPGSDRGGRRSGCRRRVPRAAIDGTEQCDGDRRRDQLAEVMDRKRREAEGGQFLRDAVEAAADGFDREFEEPCHERSHDEDGERPWRPAQQRETLREAIVGEQEDQAADGESERRQVDGMGVGGEGLDAGEELGRQAVDPEAEEILDLRHEDDDGDTVGKTDDDRHRNEADQLPHARDSHRQQEGAGEHGGAEQVNEAVGGDDAMTIGMKAPVGPPICTREPPKSEVSRPATMAVQMPAVREQPLAMAKAMASGRARTPTVMPEARSR